MGSLSSDMRLGSMVRHQAFEAFFIDGGSCALGAVCEARGATTVGTSNYSRTVTGVLDEADSLIGDMVCPACSDGSGGGSLIAHLNDDHRWSRERIADWLEGLEQARDQQQAPTEAQPALVTV